MGTAHCIWKLKEPPWGRCAVCGKRLGEAGRGAKKPPKRICEGPVEKRRAVSKKKVLEEVTELAEEGKTERTLDEMKEQIEVCFTCEYLKDTHCTLRGAACTQRKRWVEAICSHECRFVKPKEKE
jgi:hypothetical protein